MDSQKVDMFMMGNTENLPGDKIYFIRERLANMPDNRWGMLLSIEMKRPIVVLIISFLLGELGIDRFYLGQTGLGILKLITCGGFGIWWLIDLFLIMDATKEDNMRRLMTML